MILDDNSEMPFGKHKGVKMANVPADYLIFLYENNFAKGNVLTYIVSNLDVLKEQINQIERSKK